LFIWLLRNDYILYWSGKEIGASDIIKDDSSIIVYPNPTTGQLTIVSQ